MAVKATSARPARQAAELGQIPFGVALSDVDGQVGDSLSVPAVLT
jgi:hypothetical protein